MARIVIATLGSYGDIHPYIPIAIELKRRGHNPVIATSEYYRSAVQDSGIEFFPVRPDIKIGDAEVYREIMDSRRGSERIIKKHVMPFIRESYQDFERACAGADLILSHVITYYAPILAEKKKIRWLSTVLAPMVFFSAYDPPVLAPIPQLAALRSLGPKLNGPILNLLKLVSRNWSKPARDLRAELGVPSEKDPLFEGQHSPNGVLALFSKAFAEVQPDWPEKTRICGFPLHDQDIGGKSPNPRLVEFLKKGPAPIAFTLGSSAVHIPGDFYGLAVHAARSLGRRAVLVAGSAAEKLNAEHGSGSVLAVATASYHWLFNQCCAIVHQGGVGTTAQALFSGRPELIVPFAHDQFDNADRVHRIGAGLVLHLSHLNEKSLAAHLQQILEQPSFAAAARSAAETVRSERSAAAACDIIDSVLV